MPRLETMHFNGLITRNMGKSSKLTFSTSPLRGFVMARNLRTVNYFVPLIVTKWVSIPFCVLFVCQALSKSFISNFDLVEFLWNTDKKSINMKSKYEQSL